MKEQGGFLSASSPATPPPSSSFLSEAQLLNSNNIGRYSAKRLFTTRLSGRFYHDGSLERSTFRKSRLVEMQERKRRLERELELEERRVTLLQERLHETERVRDDANELIFTIQRGFIQFQAVVRRNQALKLYRATCYELQMKHFSAQFLQRQYHGRKGRMIANARREYLQQECRCKSAAYIQAAVRRRIQRRYYLDLLSERKRLGNASAVAIQAILRGKVTRQSYLTTMKCRHDASCTIQRVWRGVAGRKIAIELRELLRRRLEAEQEKPKRVPLHLRRYSTMRFQPGDNTITLQQQQQQRMRRRRSSEAMIVMMTNNKDGRASSTGAGDADENDSSISVASTLTSQTSYQTNATERNSANRKRRQHLSRTKNSPSWPSPQRVLASNDCNRRVTNITLQPNERRSSIKQRRRTISCGGGGLTTTTTPLRHNQIKQSKQLDLPPQPSCDNKDSAKSSSSSSSSSSDDELDSEVATSSKVEGNGKTSILPPSRLHENNDGIIYSVSAEASRIVHEVLGKTVLCHDIIAHSMFEDEFCENDDDIK